VRPGDNDVRSFNNLPLVVAPLAAGVVLGLTIIAGDGQPGPFGNLISFTKSR